MEDNDASGVKEHLTAQDVLNCDGNLENCIITSEKTSDIDADLDPIMQFKNNGDIYIRGRLVTNDMEVVQGFREWLKVARVIPNSIDKGE